MPERKRVIVESPYALDGQIVRNVRYARAALADCIRRGETPFASHLLYTQPGVLEDANPVERALGIDMGFQFWTAAELVTFYVDLGWSRGMWAAKDRVLALGMPWEERRIGGWQ